MLRRSPFSPLSKRSAHTTVWLMLCIGVIIAIVALAMDGGRILQERRHVQAAADAAAIAAAIDLYENYSINAGTDPSHTARDAARSSAADNGYSNDGTNSIVTVNVPPTTGDFANKAGYVEVIIQSNLASGFGTGLAGSQLSVQARAVACGKSKNIGVMVLAPTGVSVSGSGNSNVNLTGVSLTINSTDAAALTLIQNAKITADAIALAGGDNIATSATLTGTLTTGAITTPDPLASVALPDPASYTTQASTASNYSNGTITLSPGIYQGGIAISGQANVTMSAGIYIMEGGGFHFSGQGTLNATGVVIYNTTDASGSAGAISITGQGTVNLSAPTTGTYRGIALLQDRNVTQALNITGNGHLDLGGLVYAPDATVNLTGNGAAGADLFGTGYIVNGLTMAGNGHIQVTPGTNLPKVATVYLVE